MGSEWKVRPPTIETLKALMNSGCRMNRRRNVKGRAIMLHTVLIVFLILLLLGALPTWPHSANWGYGPSGGLGLVVLILLALVLTGRLGGRRQS
jgi:hypothetical protein